MRNKTTLYRRLLALLVVLALALAACGGDDDDDGEENTGADVQATATLEDAANGADGADDSADASGGSDDDSAPGAGNTIRFSVTGDAIAENTIDTRSWATTPTVGTVTIPEPDSFTLLLYEEMMNQMITFDYVPYGVTPGDYPLTSPQAIEQGEVTAAYLYDISNTYSTNVTGTLTIESADDTIAGRFEFSAAKDTDDSVTITVSGTFRDVPMPTPPADDEAASD